MSPKKKILLYKYMYICTNSENYKNHTLKLEYLTYRCQKIICTRNEQTLNHVVPPSCVVNQYNNMKKKQIKYQRMDQ